jgi:hypothetical protein
MPSYPDTIAVKSQLGKPDDKALYGPFRFNTTVLIEQQPTTYYRVDLTAGPEAFLWGAAVWGVNKWVSSVAPVAAHWDVAMWDEDYWYYSANNEDIVYINNYQDTFIWRFRFADSRSDEGVIKTHGFTDVANTTATEDTTTNYRVDFTANQVWQSSSVWIDARPDETLETVLSATLQVDTTGTFDLFMSADGGTHWEEVVNNVPYNFVYVGSDLRIKVVEVAGTTGTLNAVKCKYTRLIN